MPFSSEFVGQQGSWRKHSMRTSGAKAPRRTFATNYATSGGEEATLRARREELLRDKQQAIHSEDFEGAARARNALWIVDAQLQQLASAAAQAPASRASTTGATASAVQAPAASGRDDLELGSFSGWIKHYNEEKGFGFIVCEDLKAKGFTADVFLHKSNVGAFKTGDWVSFQAFTVGGKLRAKDLKALSLIKAGESSSRAPPPPPPPPPKATLAAATPAGLPRAPSRPCNDWAQFDYSVGDSWGPSFYGRSSKGAHDKAETIRNPGEYLMEESGDKKADFLALGDLPSQALPGGALLPLPPPPPPDKEYVKAHCGTTIMNEICWSQEATTTLDTFVGEKMAGRALPPDIDGIWKMTDDTQTAFVYHFEHTSGENSFGGRQRGGEQVKGVVCAESIEWEVSDVCCKGEISSDGMRITKGTYWRKADGKHLGLFTGQKKDKLQPGLPTCPMENAQKEKQNTLQNGGGKQEAASAAGLTTCPKRHPLEECKSGKDLNCKECGRSMPKESAFHACKPCRYHICPQCYTHGPSEKKGDLICPAKHMLEKVKSTQDLKCKECRRKVRAGSSFQACKKCRYHICQTCAQVKRQEISKWTCPSCRRENYPTWSECVGCTRPRPPSSSSQNKRPRSTGRSTSNERNNGPEAKARAKWRKDVLAGDAAAAGVLVVAGSSAPPTSSSSAAGAGVGAGASGDGEAEEAGLPEPAANSSASESGIPGKTHEAQKRKLPEADDGQQPDSGVKRMASMAAVPTPMQDCLVFQDYSRSGAPEGDARALPLGNGMGVEDGEGRGSAFGDGDMGAPPHRQSSAKHHQDGPPSSSDGEASEPDQAPTCGNTDEVIGSGLGVDDDQMTLAALIPEEWKKFQTGLKRKSMEGTSGSLGIGECLHSTPDDEDMEEEEEEKTVESEEKKKDTVALAPGFQGTSMITSAQQDIPKEELKTCLACGFNGCRPSARFCGICGTRLETQDDDEDESIEEYEDGEEHLEDEEEDNASRSPSPSPDSASSFQTASDSSKEPSSWHSSDMGFYDHEAESGFRQAEEKANREAEEMTKQELEEKARREAEMSKQKEEERVKQQEEERAKRDVHEQEHKRSIVQAVQAAFQKAEEKAKREAEERAKQEEEERAKREAERAKQEDKAKQIEEERTKPDAQEQEQKISFVRAMQDSVLASQVTFPLHPREAYDLAPALSFPLHPAEAYGPASTQQSQDAIHCPGWNHATLSDSGDEASEQSDARSSCSLEGERRWQNSYGAPHHSHRAAP